MPSAGSVARWRPPRSARRRPGGWSVARGQGIARGRRIEVASGCAVQRRPTGRAELGSLSPHRVVAAALGRAAEVRCRGPWRRGKPGRRRAGPACGSCRSASRRAHCSPFAGRRRTAAGAAVEEVLAGVHRRAVGVAELGQAGRRAELVRREHAEAALSRRAGRAAAARRHAHQALGRTTLSDPGWPGWPGRGCCRCACSAASGACPAACRRA